jgi:hypothetical protein
MVTSVTTRTKLKLISLSGLHLLRDCQRNGAGKESWSVLKILIPERNFAGNFPDARRKPRTLADSLQRSRRRARPSPFPRADAHHSSDVNRETAPARRSAGKKEAERSHSVRQHPHAVGHSSAFRYLSEELSFSS